jgi:putative FmdB family regulatory protein
MPTYEYECDACGHKFEKFHSMSAAPIKKCPVCGKNKVRRLIGTGAGLIFKGSGFYITDYRDAAYKDKAKSESGGGEGKAETKADASSSGEGKAESKSSESKSAESKPASEPKPTAKQESKESKPSKKKE